MEIEGLFDFFTQTSVRPRKFPRRFLASTRIWKTFFTIFSTNWIYFSQPVHSRNKNFRIGNVHCPRHRQEKISNFSPNCSCHDDWKGKYSHSRFFVTLESNLSVDASIRSFWEIDYIMSNVSRTNNAFLTFFWKNFTVSEVTSEKWVFQLGVLPLVEYGGFWRVVMMVMWRVWRSSVKKIARI